MEGGVEAVEGEGGVVVVEAHGDHAGEVEELADVGVVEVFGSDLGEEVEGLGEELVGADEGDVGGLERGGIGGEGEDGGAAEECVDLAAGGVAGVLEGLGAIEGELDAFFGGPVFGAAGGVVVEDEGIAGAGVVGGLDECEDVVGVEADVVEGFLGEGVGGVVVGEGAEEIGAGFVEPLLDEEVLLFAVLDAEAFVELGELVVEEAADGFGGIVAEEGVIERSEGLGGEFFDGGGGGFGGGGVGELAEEGIGVVGPGGLGVEGGGEGEEEEGEEAGGAGHGAAPREGGCPPLVR